MSRLTERFEQDAVHDGLAELRSALDALDSEARKAAEAVAEGVVLRAEHVLAYVEGVLGAADPELVNPADLQPLANAAAQGVAAATALASDANQATALDGAADALVTTSAALIAASSLVADRAKKSSKAFDSALRSAVKEVREQTKELAHELEETRAELATARQEADAANAEREHLAEQAATALTARIDQEESRLVALASDHETKFLAAQEERDQEFKRDVAQEESAREKTAKNAEEERETELAKVQTKGEDAIRTIQTDGQNLLAEVEGVRDDIVKLRGFAADVATTGEFQKEASAQKSQADAWRKATVVFAAAAVVIAIALGFAEPNGSTATVVAKLSATVAAAGVAAYAGKQSGIHRERETTAKRLELELVAFPSFIQELDPAQQRDIRRDYAERAFSGRPEDTPSGSADSIGPTQLGEVLGEALAKVLGTTDGGGPKKPI